jgi:hypothetical protein
MQQQQQEAAARYIQRIWRKRRVVTLQAGCRTLEAYGLTIQETGKMTTPALKKLITTIKPVNTFIAILRKVLSRCVEFEEPSFVQHKCIEDNPWIFVRAFAFYHHRVHTNSANLKRVCKDMTAVSHCLLDELFGILKQNARRLDQPTARRFSATVSAYIRTFHTWNDEITSEHRKKETELLTQDVIIMAEFSEFRKHTTAVYAIHEQLNGPTVSRRITMITQEECIRQLLDTIPLPDTCVFAAANKWKTFKRAIKETHCLIKRLRGEHTDNIEIFIYAAEEPKGTEARLTASHPPFPAVMDDFLALAVMEHRKFDYKAQEYTLQLNDGDARFTITDLGKQCMAFKNCKMIWHITHGHHSMALILNTSSQFGIAPHMVFTRGSSIYDINLIPVDGRTVYITMEKKDATAAASPIGVAIVELKLCAACGKPAQHKCAVCWANARQCIRYCSKECQATDLVRHRTYCGRSFEL